MKIGQPGEKPAPNGADAVRGGAAPAAKPAQTQPVPGNAEASAKVELSSTAATLAKKAVNPEFDADKVQQVSQSINDGSYRVNPEKIADRLIANAQEVLGKVPK